MTHDDKFLISASSNYNEKAIKLWDLQTKNCVFTFQNAHSGMLLMRLFLILDYFKTMIVTYDNKLLITASSDQSIKLWNIVSKNCIHTFEKAHLGPITGLALTPDSKYILSASYDKNIKIWSLNERKCIQTFEKCFNGRRKFFDNLLDGVSSIGVTHQGHYMIAGAVDGSIKIKPLPLPSENSVNYSTKSPISKMKGRKESKTSELSLIRQSSGFSELKKKAEQFLSQLHDLQEKYSNKLFSISDLPPSSSSLNLTFTIKTIPSSNYNLFQAVVYALDPRLYRGWQSELELLTTIEALRDLVKRTAIKHAKSIPALSELQSTMSIKEYTESLSKQDFVGGEVELQLLALHYDIQFYVFRVSGEGVIPDVVKFTNSHKKRIFLVFDTLEEKYDVIVGESYLRAKLEMEMSIFNCDDIFAYKQALYVAEGAKGSE
jgi:hypothetical protein